MKDNGANPIRHRNYMPVTSGMEYKVTEYEQGKFRLEELTIKVHRWTIPPPIPYLWRALMCG